MKNKLEGFTTGRILALLLVAAMILTLGLTAAASADDGEDEEIAVIDIAEPAEEATEDFEEIAVLDEETLIKAAEEAKREAEEAKQAEAETEEAAQAGEADKEPAEAKAFTEACGNLGANLLNIASAELTNLTDTQREAIIAIWTANDLHLSPEDMLAAYAEAGLSTETGFVLLLANADACVRYVTENYDGGENPVYVNTFAEGFADTCRALDWLESGSLSDPESTARVIEIVGNGYAEMATAGDTEAELLGYNPINDLVNAYGAAQGKADAQAFLALFD